MFVKEGGFVFEARSGFACRGQRKDRDFRGVGG